MPVIEVKRDRLFERLGPEDEFQLFMFEYGLELDDVTSERSKAMKETGIADETLSDEIIYKIEVPANRYDLLCEEGIARALLIYMGKMGMPTYDIKEAKHTLNIDESVDPVRPYCVAAILRDITFDETNFQNFIKLQTKLHGSVCRRRSLASVGTHDLDTIEGPFYYKAMKPEDIVFAPLDTEEKVDGHQLMKNLETVNHLSPFLNLIRDEPKYPVILDKNGTVCSLPPIINSNHSKMTMNTKNVLIEVTATDYTKANIVLNTLVTMFSEYCSESFSIESVIVKSADGTEKTFPEFEEREVVSEVEYIESMLGVEIGPNEMVQYLSKMSIPARLSDDKKLIIASIHPTRTDIFHKCDLVEDVGIAYGFNNLEYRFPATSTKGKEFYVNKGADLIRHEAARSGFTELLTFSLLSWADNFDFLRAERDKSAVVISNPATEEFQVVRTTLLPGMLKTLKNNAEVALPLRVFEASDVVFTDDSEEEGAVNRRHFCAVNMDVKSDFEFVHGLLDRIMLIHRYRFQDNERGYYIRESNKNLYLDCLQAEIVIVEEGEETVIGHMGILHPEILVNFKLKYPCASIEIDIQHLAADE